MERAQFEIQIRKTFHQIGTTPFSLRFQPYSKRGKGDGRVGSNHSSLGATWIDPTLQRQRTQLLETYWIQRQRKKTTKALAYCSCDFRLLNAVYDAALDWCTFCWNGIIWYVVVLKIDSGTN